MVISVEAIIPPKVSGCNGGKGGDVTALHVAATFPAWNQSSTKRCLCFNTCLLLSAFKCFRGHRSMEAK